MSKLDTVILSQYGLCALTFISVRDLMGVSVKNSDFKNLDINQRPHIESHIRKIHADILRADPTELFFTELKHITVQTKKVVKLGDAIDVRKMLAECHIGDGQHSIRALQSTARDNPEWLDHQVMVMLYFNLPPKQENRLFLNVNGKRRSPSPDVIDLNLAEQLSNGWEVADEERAAYAHMAHQLAIHCRAMKGRVKQPFHDKPIIGFQFHAVVIGIKEASKNAGVDLLSMTEGQRYDILSACWNSIEIATDDMLFGDNWKRMGHSAMFVCMLAGALTAVKKLGVTRNLSAELVERAGPGYRAFLAEPRALEGKFKHLGGSFGRTELIKKHIEIMESVIQGENNERT